MTNLKLALATGLAAATLAVVLTYVLGGQALLQSDHAEPGHNLVMSLMRGIGGPVLSESQMQSPMHGIIGNNMLGGQATLPAGGLAAVVIISVIALAATAFVVSWKQRSFAVAGLMTASGIILMILPLANMNFVFPGPIIGVVVGLVIFGLGVTKGIRTATGVTVAPK